MSKPDFFQPVMKQDIKSLEKIVSKSNNSINEVDAVGMTALHWAALYNKDKSVAFLLSKGSQTSIKDNKGITSYNWASHHNNKKCAQMIKLKTQAEQMGWPILNWIAKEGEHEFVSLFINHLNANFVDKDFGRSALHWAVYSAKIHKNSKTLKRMLDCDGIYIDLKDQCDGRTATCMAVYLNDIETLRMLIEKRPNLDIKDNNPSYSPLMWAIHRNSPKMVKILVAASASISESDLKLANKTRNKEIIDILEYSMSFDPYIKEYVSLLYNVRNNEEKSRDTWHKSTKDKSGNFYRLPEPIQHLLNNSFTIISEGPSSFFNNISNKQNKFERILDNPKSNSPAEFLSNEDILITRLKSELKEFF